MNEFVYKKRIYYHDTDCGNVVYYANYLKYLEEARTEHLRSMGIDLNELAKEEKALFAVAGVDIRYKSPARYSDELTIISRIGKAKAASIEFSHEIKRGKTLLVECETRLVCLGEDFKPRVMPEAVSEAICGK